MKKLLFVLLAFCSILLNAADGPKEKSNKIVVNVDLGKESIWVTVFTAEFMWVKIPKFLIHGE